MGPLTPRRLWLSVGVCALAAVAAILISPGVGTTPLGLVDAWKSLGDPEGHAQAYTIAFGLRLPRAGKALLVGMTLALCGAVFQTLFRNPLATPYTLGIASGGSLGALVAIKLGLVGGFLFLSPVTLCAFAGAAAVVAAVATLARATRGMSSNSLLLGGVTIAFFCSALMLFVQYFASEREAFAIMRWMMGSLETVGIEEAFGLLPLLVVAWGVLLMQARALNQYELGEEVAASRGVDPGHLQAVCIGFASLATAAVVSVCGPIGFVGLIVPHAVRGVFGRDARILLPTAALLGGTFLIVCDWVSALGPRVYGRLVGQEYIAHLPIGVTTALIGAPLFLVILRRRLR
ncbi:MAG TPA: iron ABC transporter permease [Phycisphaerae bacterium]|nr:iron ABC transporter permease [Phycisphaerae bacterium]